MHITITEGRATVIADLLDSIKGRLKADVDRVIEAERLQYITGGAGQAMVYQRKEQEARRFLSGEDQTPGPHLVAEIGITGEDAEAVAERIVELADQWAQMSAELEARRLGVKKLISEAQTVTQAEEAHATILLA